MDRILEFENYEITFDDGNRSDLEIALPILLERGLSARFFVLASRISNPKYLSADNLRSMTEAGMKIGSHGLNHQPWTKLSEQALDDELSLSKQILSDITGKEVTDAACPFGKYNPRVLRALKKHAYRHVYTCDGGWSARGAFRVSRWMILHDNDSNVLQDLIRPSLPSAIWQQARQIHRRAKAISA
jgi:peptidoglycan/xylan/chitin deacetylase (PgdA/CDA1 family)